MRERFVCLKECARVEKGIDVARPDGHMYNWVEVERVVADGNAIEKLVGRFMEPILSELGLYDNRYSWDCESHNKLVRFLCDESDKKNIYVNGSFCGWLEYEVRKEISSALSKYDANSLRESSEMIDIMGCLMSLLKSAYLRREIYESWGGRFCEEIGVKYKGVGYYEVPEWKLKEISDIMAELAMIAGDEELSGEFRLGKRYGERRNVHLVSTNDF